MFKDTITYTDFNGDTVSEDVYFNMTKAEYIKWEIERNGKLTEEWQRIVNSEDTIAMISTFIDMVNRAYGVKSEDGKRFIKSDDILENFTQSMAYDVFLDKLLTEDGYTDRFLKGIIPVSEHEWEKALNEVKKSNNIANMAS